MDKPGRLYAVNTYEDALFTSRPKHPVYAQKVCHVLSQWRLPNEMIDTILEELDEYELVEIPGTRRPRQTPLLFCLPSIPSIPLANGACLLLKLPDELLRAVFSASLPSRSQVVEPSCGARVETLEQGDRRPNRVTDLMLLNKQLCQHIAEMVYEERIFSIHVHQGLRNAGIEFLHVGRQPLQYQADVSDNRFAKFSPGEIFGFSRLKKLEIVIFPSDGRDRHMAINTYYMMFALVNLLGREEKRENRITSLEITFVARQRDHCSHGRRAIMDVENPWWDADNHRPRETSFHGISDIEFVLRPFALLWGVHNLHIKLPALVESHLPTIEFVLALKRCMQGWSQSATFIMSRLNVLLEGMRTVHENYMMKVMYGAAGDDDKIEGMSDDDGGEDDENDNDDEEGDGGGGGGGGHDSAHEDDDDDDDDDDDGDDGPDGEHNKRRLSPTSNNIGGGRKRVHYSSETSSGGLSGTGESSRGNFDPFGNDTIFNERLLAATKSENSLIAKFVEFCGTTEVEARDWLRRSDGDIDIAVTEFMSADDRTQAAVREYKVEMMTGDLRAPLKDQDRLAGRGTDDRMSPTRFGRAGPSSLISRVRDQLTSFSKAVGPSSRTRAQQQHLLGPLPTQEEEAQQAKIKGKGKGRAKRIDTDDNVESTATCSDPSKYDESIASWNDPSNFSHREHGQEPSNAQDVQMTDSGLGLHQPDRPTANATHRAIGEQILSGDGFRYRELAEEAAAEVRSEVESLYVAPGNDADVFGSSGPSTLLPRHDSVMDRPRSQGRPNGNLPTRPDPALPSVARPCNPLPTSRHRRRLLSTTTTQQPAQQEIAAALESREQYRRIDAILNPQAFPSTSTEASRTVTDILNSDYMAETDYGYQLQLASPPPAPTTSANTVEDYPQWAGTSYWTVPASAFAPAPAPTPAPAPEAPTWSSASAANPLALRFAASATTSRPISGTAPSTSRYPILRALYPDRDEEVYAAAAAPTTGPGSGANITTSPRQYRANQDYWAKLRPEFGDEVLNISSDAEGEL